MEGNRPRGRPRFWMIDDLKEGSYVKMKMRVEDRVAWWCWMPGPAWEQRTNENIEILMKSKLIKN